MFVHAQLKAQCNTEIQDIGYVNVIFLFMHVYASLGLQGIF